MQKIIMATVVALSTISFSVQAQQETVVAYFQETCQMSEAHAKKAYKRNAPQAEHIFTSNGCPVDSPFIQAERKKIMENMKKSMANGENPFAMMKERLKNLK